MEVIDALEQARRQYGLPTTIRVDQGSQFTPKQLDLWAYANGIMAKFELLGIRSEMNRLRLENL